MRSKMKRRDFIMKIASGLIVTELAGCSYLGFTVGNRKTTREKNPPPKIPDKSSTRGTSRRKATPEITDLKTLSNLLEKANRPLNEAQIDYLLTLKPGPLFAAKMMEILTDDQKQAVNNPTKGRRRR